eukprot:GHVL01001983.1.p1 GENE.GHVL01001983.1~~GHVL01001983.1.p1  ORF type:complete len:877 (-),score=137.86 GHVL01001983.1:905-3487(-)
MESWPVGWCYECNIQATIINQKDYRLSPTRKGKFNCDEPCIGFDNICSHPFDPNSILLNPRGGMLFRCHLTLESEKGKEAQYNGLIKVTGCLNALVQCLFFIKEFKEGIYRICERNNEKCMDDTPEVDTVTALCNIFQKLEQKGPVNCDELITSMNFDFLIKDVRELLQELFNTVDELTEDTSHKGFIKNLMGGLFDLGGGYLSTKEFIDFKLTVDGSSSLEESLEILLQTEIIDVCETDECETDVNKGVAKKSVSLVPPVLFIHICRSDYLGKNKKKMKNNDYWAFPIELNMDKYSDSGGVYLLHSVISECDGHYVAYVRPNVEDNQWYRFCDENVTHASEWAAVENNYGGRMSLPINWYQKTRAVNSNEHQEMCLNTSLGLKDHSACMLIYRKRIIDATKIINTTNVLDVGQEDDSKAHQTQCLLHSFTRVIVRLVTDKSLYKMEGVWEPTNKLPPFAFSFIVDKNIKIEKLMEDIFSEEEIGLGILYVTLFALSFQRMKDQGVTLVCMSPHSYIQRYINKDHILDGTPVIYVFLVPPQSIYPYVFNYSCIPPATLASTAEYCQKCFKDEVNGQIVGGVRNSLELPVRSKFMYTRPRFVLFTYFCWKTQKLYWLGMTVLSMLVHTDYIDEYSQNKDEYSQNNEYISASYRRDEMLLLSAIMHRLLYFSENENIEIFGDKIHFLASFTHSINSKPKWKTMSIFGKNSTVDLDYGKDREGHSPALFIVTQTEPSDEIVLRNITEQKVELSALKKKLWAIHDSVESYINTALPVTCSDSIFLLSYQPPSMERLGQQQLVINYYIFYHINYYIFYHINYYIFLSYYFFGFLSSHLFYILFYQYYQYSCYLYYMNIILYQLLF